MFRDIEEDYKDKGVGTLELFNGHNTNGHVQQPTEVVKECSQATSAMLLQTIKTLYYCLEYCCLLYIELLYQFSAVNC